MTMYVRTVVPMTITISSQDREDDVVIDSRSPYKVLPLWAAQRVEFQELWDEEKVEVATDTAFTNIITSIPVSELDDLPSVRGLPNGVASLDSSGKVPASQLPNSIMDYKGVWNVSTNTPALANGTGSAGDVYRVTVAGASNLQGSFGPYLGVYDNGGDYSPGQVVLYNGSYYIRIGEPNPGYPPGSGYWSAAITGTVIVFDAGDYAIYNGTVWEKSDTTDAVASVAGLTGAISASGLRTALSINNVDNTSDATKNSAVATLTNKTLTSPTLGGTVTLSGDVEATSGRYIRFGHPSQTNANDGMIGAALSGTGLSIFGVQTSAGLGRVVRIFGNLINDNGSSYVTTTSTHTLTNKTLTSPVIGAINDINGNVAGWFGGTASAVNFIQMGNSPTGGRPALRAQGSDTNIGMQIVPKGTGTVVLADSAFQFILEAVGVTSSVNNLIAGNAATGTDPFLQATGTDTNVSLNLRTKGTGVVKVNGVGVVTTSGTQSLTNKTLLSPVINDANGNAAVRFPSVASAVNWPYFSNAAANNAPSIGVDGSDTNINIAFTSKGTGILQLFRPGGHSTVQAAGSFNSGNINLDLRSQGTGVVQANGNPVVTSVSVPATATSTGAAGQIAYDSAYVYVCIAANTWRRAELLTW